MQCVKPKKKCENSDTKSCLRSKNDLVLATKNRLFRIIGNFFVQNLKVISIKLLLFDFSHDIAMFKYFRVQSLTIVFYLFAVLALLAFLQ
jgi:hypothetical protein